jgi:glutaredoxin-like YruB-family protein
VAQGLICEGPKKNINMKEIKSHDELIAAIKGISRSYVLLYKPGSSPNECALQSIREAAGNVQDVSIMIANVAEVRDIHPHYPVESVPSLLVFENGKFINVIKGCNDYRYYKTLFEEGSFASVNLTGKASKHVTVYTTPTCSWCNTLKSYLRTSHISFTEVDISRDPGAAEDLVRRTGQQGVPQTDIEGTVVVGFDKKRINELLGIA